MSKIEKVKEANDHNIGVWNDPTNSGTLNSECLYPPRAQIAKAVILLHLCNLESTEHKKKV